MAARKNKILHADKTKALIRASQLLNRLTAHANGDVEMSASQVLAARIVIGKVIPDLKSVELSGNPDRPFVTRVERVIVQREPVTIEAQPLRLVECAH